MKKSVSLLLICLFSLTSCKKFLEGYSPNLVVAKHLSDLDEVLLGSCYVLPKQLNYLTSNDLAVWLNYLDDDVNTVVGRSAATNPLGPFGSSAQMNYLFGYTTWQFDVGKSYYGTATYSDASTWRDLYKRINVLNIVLDEIEHITYNDAEKPEYHRIKAEAHFLRAQFYLFLVNIYAEPYSKVKASGTLGIPLKLTPYVEHKSQSESQFERTSVQLVYGQIVKDLEMSIENFEVSSKRPTYLRASGTAAHVLLSRVFLYMENYSDSKHHGLEALKRNAYIENITIPDPSYIFLNPENSEILFSQGSLNLQTTFVGAPRDVCVSADLTSIYQAEDARYGLFFKKNRYSDSIVLNSKFKSGAHLSTVSDQFLIRTSEAYLNIAEAAAQLGEDGLANEYINKLRVNRILNYQNVEVGGKELVDQIRTERRKELCFEGHRWFDLRRYSVNSKYPFNKEIVRQFGVYSDNGNFIQLEEYILKEHDPAYTFQIPIDVREFQPGMITNKRDVRNPVKITNIIF